MKKLLVLAVVSLFVCIAANAGEAAMRCGNFFVDKGVQLEEVRYYCGEPTTESEEGTKGYRSGQRVIKWIYGPDAGYLYILFFKGGVLEELQESRIR